ncbi:MAG: NADH-quinone oxidoreductase subunit N [Pedosphaera sp.]|nr:NADH-quinone oxidoreductase subunit N [Pedosphaera sp.]
MDYPGLIKLLAPECVVVLTALAVLFADVKFWRGLPNGRRFGRGVTLSTVGLMAAALFAEFGENSADVLMGTLVLTPVSQFLKLVLLLLTLATVWLCGDTDFTDHVGEFLALLLLAATGMMLLISTENLLMIFVSLELVSLSLYVITAFNKRSSRSAEAALKYFLFGGMAAGFTLFGFSLLYGLCGSIHLPDIALALNTKGSDPLARAAVVMVLAGFGFKIAAVPFHFWAPDAYEGAPAPAAAFIASGSKVASFFILTTLLQSGMPGAAGSGAWKAFVPGWMPIVAILATASMVFGNLAALAQSGLRRLLACSAIAHAGYALLAVLADPPDAKPALLYYVTTYAMTLVGMFGLVSVVERGHGDDSIGRLAGLSQRSPLLAACLSVFSLSLAGVPPLSGFFGKFYVFVALVKSGPSYSSHFWLALVAIAMSCVSLYYYLQVLKQVWVGEPLGDTRPAKVSAALTFVVAGLALGVVLLGCAPELLLAHFR